MKKLLLFVLTVCLLLCLAACTQPPAPDPVSDPVPDPVPAEPPVPEEEIQDIPKEEISKNPGFLWIETNGEVFLPYDHWVWSDSHEEDGSVLCADGEPISTENYRDFVNFVDDLPCVTYADDFEIFLDENVTSSSFTVYDMNHSEITKGSSFSKLQELPAGEYIVEIPIKVRWDYVEAANAYDSSGYECWFRLTMPA